MVIKDTAYNNTLEDFNDMHSFLREVYRLTGKPQVWEFVRLEFWSKYPSNGREDPDFFFKNAHLWRNEAGQLVGLFISERGKEYFSIIIHPDYHFLEETIIEWVKSQWAEGKSSLVTDAYPYNSEIAAFLRAGFVEEEHIGNTRLYELESMELTPVLQEGYTIKCITEAPDYLGKWESMQRAYHPDEPLAGDTSYWRADLPGYIPELDLSVISSEGKHISFCYGFIDKADNSAIIETVGTHPDYQQRGFGKAVITECFRRLRDRGVKTAYITGYSEAANALYHSLGAAEIYPLYSYRFKKD